MLIRTLSLFLLTWTCMGFYTNVNHKYVWTTKSIDFFIWNQNSSKIPELESIVNLTLSTLDHAVGPLITWKKVTSFKAEKKDRYFMFVFAKANCIGSSFASKGASIIPLSVTKGCDVYTNIHNILRALGFVSPHLRGDRDDFVTIHYENIFPVDHQVHEKCSSCMTSDDPVFKKYDFESLLHPPKFNPYSIDYNKPTITAKNDENNILLKHSYDYSGRTLSANDILVFKAVYGKKKLAKNY